MAEALNKAGLVYGYNPGSDVARWHRKTDFKGHIAQVHVPLWKEAAGQPGLWPQHPNVVNAAAGQSSREIDLSTPSYQDVLAQPVNREGFYEHASADVGVHNTKEKLHRHIDENGFPLIDHAGGEADHTVHVPLRFSPNGSKAKAKVLDGSLGSLPRDMPPVNTRSNQTITQIAAGHLPQVLAELERQKQTYADNPQAMARAATSFAVLSAAAPFRDNVRHFLALHDMADGLGGKDGRDAGFERLTDLLTSAQMVPMGAQGAKVGQAPSALAIPDAKTIAALDKALARSKNPQDTLGLIRSLAGNNMVTLFNAVRANPALLTGDYAHGTLHAIAQNGEPSRVLASSQIKGMSHKTLSFATHMTFPDTPKVLTLDTHMHSMFDQAYGGPGLGGGFKPPTYAAAERWFGAVLDHHLRDHTEDGTKVAPFAKQWATWDAMYGAHVPHEVVWRAADGEKGKDLREVWAKQDAKLASFYRKAAK